MRVILCTNFNIGQTGEFAYTALLRMGHEIIPITRSESAPPEWVKVDPQADAMQIYSDHPADLFVLVESSDGRPFLPRRIDELPIPTACWYYDNYLNFRWNKEVISLFDYSFFAQLYRAKQAKQYSGIDVTWLPFAADEIFHRNFNVKRDIDIGYVGSITDQKKKYFADLEKSGLTVTTNDRYLSYEEIGKFYSRCKLVYNILARRDMNVRTFEAPMGGALLVNQGWIDEGCYDIFTPGKNMMFHNFTDAGDICKKLLADGDSRERMATAGQKIVANGHTYRHRMQKLLKICGAGIRDDRMKRRAGFCVALSESLTCSHRDFRFHDRARDNFLLACKGAPLSMVKHLFRYGWWRIKEKIEKIVWSFGKAPV